ncbi:MULTISPECIES: Imm26 family immunity protein [Pseudomonas fluorescens group]|uniref:Uncharacterized protein n=1 Tax=Pseudomonas fluorescens TaxID=294 RepID=A0A0D0TC47_PSEFL|nr:MULTISPECIES: Imm26 family immunity protein [Pseudomonas fluorescens group]AZE59409.1 hypothetical protein C4K02_1031 [Pseudomonas synxantha]KIR21111.1 hypothetical protein PFLU3_34090 [Pseudomonas fluorescens]
MSILKVSEGDIICIPACKHKKWGFVLGRIVLNSHYVTWLEVFSKYHSDFSISRDEILRQNFSKNNRLFNPVHVSLDFGKYFGKIKWPTIHTNNYNQADSNIEDIEFASPDYKISGIFYKNNKELHEPADRRRPLEDCTIYSNPQLIHRINLHLSGIANKTIPWNAETIHNLIEQRSIKWWLDGIQYCADSVDAAAREFKISKQ